jgi:hypothetical protein
MIQKSEYFEQADLYINEDLSQDELIEFESQMAFDQALAAEVRLQLDIQLAICETDIIDLRNSVSQIIQNNKQDNVKVENTDQFKFDLAEGSLVGKNLNQIETDGINLESSFPKIHLYQHKVASKENIHQFYKEQFDSVSSSTEELEFSQFDEKIFAEVQAALDENDISELRANLRQVAISVPTHKYTSEEIDDYINNLMDSENKNRFEEELSVNQNLANEVFLVRDMNMAIAESDILELRANLNKIQHSEIQKSASIEELEKYLNNELNSVHLASFEANIASNKKLREEIELIKDIDKALIETDIMQLRYNLKNISEQIDDGKQKERSFIGKFRIKHLIPYTTVAASIVFILVFSGIFSSRESSPELYQKFYTKYEIAGTVRSADISQNNTFSLAMQKYENQQYEEALTLFTKVIADDPNNIASHFYSGASLQETGRYSKAISEYENVIINKDNLFTEQAEWYTALCLLQTKENKKALKLFKKIAQSEGFYKQKAGQILTKIKNKE